MKEITGELWDFYGKENFVVCITTNGTVRKDGACVMGRGCAAEAAKRHPAYPYLVGDIIKTHGNHAWRSVITGKDPGQLMTFPVKHQWHEQADVRLIERSAKELTHAAELSSGAVFILPRPGCGNGWLTWEQVKPVIEFLPDNVWVISK